MNELVGLVAGGGIVSPGPSTGRACAAAFLLQQVEKMSGPIADPFGLQNKLGINYETLQAARKVVERVWQGHKKYPTHLKTAYEQDRIIASLGPVAIEKMVKALTDTGHRTPQPFVFLDHRGEKMK